MMFLTLSKLQTSSSRQETEAEKQANQPTHHTRSTVLRKKRRKVSELVNLEIKHMKVLIEGMTTIMHLN
jgi:hypothetical protein